MFCKFIHALQISVSPLPGNYILFADKNDSVRTDSEAEKQLEHLTQKYEEAQRTLKANEDKILQLKSKLFDFIQKNEKNEEDKKKLSDIIYNGKNKILMSYELIFACKCLLGIGVA